MGISPTLLEGVVAPDLGVSAVKVEDVRGAIRPCQIHKAIDAASEDERKTQERRDGLLAGGGSKHGCRHCPVWL